MDLYLRVPHELLFDASLDATQLRCLLVAAAHADLASGENARPSYQTIGQKAGGIHRDTVKRALKVAREKGRVTWTTHVSEKGEPETLRFRFPWWVGASTHPPQGIGAPTPGHERTYHSASAHPPVGAPTHPGRGMDAPQPRALDLEPDNRDPKTKTSPSGGAPPASGATEADLFGHTGKRRDVTAEARALIAAYNEACPSLTASKGGENALKAAKAALTRADLLTWAERFKRAEASDFLACRTTAAFKADFAWLVKPANAEKLDEGKYDNRTPCGTAVYLPDEVY